MRVPYASPSHQTTSEIDAAVRSAVRCVVLPKHEVAETFETMSYPGPGPDNLSSAYVSSLLKRTPSSIGCLVWGQKCGITNSAEDRKDTLLPRLADVLARNRCVERFHHLINSYLGRYMYRGKSDSARFTSAIPGDHANATQDMSIGTSRTS